MKLRGLSLLILLPWLLAACGSGGGASGGLSNNACEEIGLPVKKMLVRIINGTACGDLKHSPVVRVILVSAGGQQAGCTGTMLTGRDVLTAAHCFMNRPRRVFIVYGDVPNTTTVRALNWEVHPDFGGTGPALLYDAAVIHLSMDLDLPILPVLVSTAPEDGDKAAIYGYGEDEKGDLDFADLRSGQMRLAEVSEHNIRADYNGDGSDTCLGDSGGPLVLDPGGQAAVVGITSTGTKADCSVGDQSYFTNLQDPGVLTFLRAAAPDAWYY